MNSVHDLVPWEDIPRYEEELAQLLVTLSHTLPMDKVMRHPDVRRGRERIQASVRAAGAHGAFQAAVMQQLHRPRTELRAVMRELLVSGKQELAVQLLLGLPQEQVTQLRHAALDIAIALCQPRNRDVLELVIDNHQWSTAAHQRPGIHLTVYKGEILSILPPASDRLGARLGLKSSLN